MAFKRPLTQQQLHNMSCHIIHMLMDLSAEHPEYAQLAEDVKRFNSYILGRLATMKTKPTE